MTIYHYALRYGSVSRYISTEESLAMGSIIRLLKPADDRSPSDDYRITIDDLTPMIVQKTMTEYHELPSGGFRRVTVLDLAPPVRPQQAVAPNPDG